MIRTEPVSLECVDGFIDRIRPYVRVRLRDRLLIIVPNQAYKLNETACRVLKHLLDGGSITEVETRLDENESGRRELYYFFCDLGALLRGCVGEGTARKAVASIPFALPFNTL